jgi:Rrf2 family transcriptional regulator, nitric oxide-sensitive transcriptional repressor
MRLTQLTDFSMRVLIHLAQHPQRLCTIGEVAARYGISQAHLMKITHQLGRAGWVTTVRGKGGGMTLALPPSEIPLGQVARSMEPDFHVVECFSGGSSCMLTGSCKLTGVIDGALRSFMDHLDRHTLQDILPDPPGQRAVQIVQLRPALKKAMPPL